MPFTKDPQGRQKPHVVSCRLDDLTHENFMKKLNGQSRQGFLEGIIKKHLEGDHAD